MIPILGPRAAFVSPANFCFLPSIDRVTIPTALRLSAGHCARQPMPLPTLPLLQVYPLYQKRQFPGCHLLASGLAEWELKRTRFQALVSDRPAVSIPVHNLHPVRFSGIAEHKQMHRKWIAPDDVLSHHR